MQEPFAGVGWSLTLPVAATLAVGGMLLAPLPMPPEGTDSILFGLPHIDKLVHLLLFLALGWIWRRSLARAGRPVSYLAIFAAVVAYGGLLELLQGATGIRSAEWADFAADALGAGLVPFWRWAPARDGAAANGEGVGAGGGAGAGARSGDSR